VGVISSRLAVYRVLVGYTTISEQVIKYISLYINVVFLDLCMSNLSYLNSGGNIPLNAIDVFWTKLDFAPSSAYVPPQVNVREDMEQMTQFLLVQDEPVQRSYLSRFKAMINPGKTNNKPPNVQTNTRGRPKKEKHYVNTLDLPRHSSHVNQQSDVPVPPRLSLGSRVKSKQSHIPYVPGDEEKNNFIRYKDWIPSILHPYIVRTEDIVGDGNCGFRAIARGLGLDQNMWQYIRTELLQELDGDLDNYIKLFDDCASLRYSLEWSGMGFAPPEYWMNMPTCGILAANRFGVVITFIERDISYTIFPFHVGPEVVMPHNFIAIALVNNNHFIRVHLTDDHPMPPINEYWRHRRTSYANNWEVMYKKRLDDYADMMAALKPRRAKTKEVITISSSSKPT
jgi:hypothetical protein